MKPTLHTARIEMVPMRPPHLELLTELDTDPVVMRYLRPRPRTLTEIAEFWGPRCTEDGDLGFWVGFTGGDFLGWWDLEPPGGSGPAQDADEAEIGWRLAPRHWRQGLATEGARALLTHAFHTVGLRRVWAQTMAVNAGSRGVMRALGMRHVRTEYPTPDDPIPGTEEGEVCYAITAEEWLTGP